MDAISSEACSMKSRVKTRPARHYIARWTPEEDAILLEHVMLHGTSQWGLLQRSNRLPLRDNKACCNRFILLKKKFIEQDGSSAVAHGAFPAMGPDPVRSSAPGGGALPLPPLTLPPVGEPHHWSVTAAVSALHSAANYHSLRSGNQQSLQSLRSGNEHSLGSGNHPSHGSYQHSHQHHLSAGGLLASSTTSPHSTSLNSLNSTEAYSFTAAPLRFSSPYQHHQHPKTVSGGGSIPGKTGPVPVPVPAPADASAQSPHHSLLVDAMPPRNSSPHLVVDLTGDWGFTAADAAASSAAAASATAAFAAAACSDNSTSLSANPTQAALTPHHAAFATSAAFPSAQQTARSSTALSPCAAPRTPRGPQALAVAAPPGAGTPHDSPPRVAPLAASSPGAAPFAASPRTAAPPDTPTPRGVQLRPSASTAPPPPPPLAASPAAAAAEANRVDLATAGAYAAASAAAASVASAAAAYVSGGGVGGVDERARKRARMMGPRREEMWEETTTRLYSDGTEMSDESPPLPLHQQHQQQQRNAMNHAGNTVPSSPALPASSEVNPSAATPAHPAVQVADASGVFTNAGCGLSVGGAAFAGRNCAGQLAEKAGVADECRETHSSIADTKTAADAAAAAAAGGGLYAGGSVLVPDSELLACLNSLTSCLSWPDLTLLDTEAGVGKPSGSPFKAGGVGYSPCMIGRLGVEMGELIDGSVVPREDGEVPALRPDFLLEMMSSG